MKKTVDTMKLIKINSIMLDIVLFIALVFNTF